MEHYLIVNHSTIFNSDVLNWNEYSYQIRNTFLKNLSQSWKTTENSLIKMSLEKIQSNEFVHQINKLLFETADFSKGSTGNDQCDWAMSIVWWCCRLHHHHFSCGYTLLQKIYEDCKLKCNFILYSYGYSEWGR